MTFREPNYYKADKDKTFVRKDNGSLMGDAIFLGGLPDGTPDSIDNYKEVDAESVKDAGPTAEELLAQAKAIKIDQIRAYNDSSAVNSFCVNGNPMGWLNPTQRMNYRQTVEAAQRKGMTIIPFMGVNIPVATVLSAIDDLDIYAWAQTQCNEICIKAVNALTTVEEVEAYDFKDAFGMTTRPDFTLK